MFVLTASCMHTRYFLAASTPWSSLTELWHAMERSVGWDARVANTATTSGPDPYSSLHKSLMSHVVKTAVRTAPGRPAVAVAVAQVVRLIVYIHRRGESVLPLEPGWAATLLAPYL